MLDFLYGSIDHIVSFSNEHVYFFPFVFFFFGSVVASVEGVLLTRLPLIYGWNGKKVKNLSLFTPGSHCDHCRRPISLVYLIPVFGWIFSRGRCNHCGHDISPLYPSIEFVSGVFSFAIIYFNGLSFNGLILCFLFYYLLFVSLFDWNEHEIPDTLTIPLFFVGLLLSPFDADPMSRIMGGAIAALMSWVAFAFISKTKNMDLVAVGDIFLMTALSSWIGVNSFTYYIFISCLIYISYAYFLKYSRGQVMVPMGPALSGGFFVLLFFSHFLKDIQFFSV